MRTRVTYCDSGVILIRENTLIIPAQGTRNLRSHSLLPWFDRAHHDNPPEESGAFLPARQILHLFRRELINVQIHCGEL